MTTRREKRAYKRPETLQQSALPATVVRSTDADDDIEESQFEPPRRLKLVQPVQTNTLNSKRFKPTKRPAEIVSSGTAEVVGRRRKSPRRTTKRAKDKMYSVSDLVDSDGVSLT